MNVSDQREYERKLSSWQREQERQKVEFTITENDLDADLCIASAEVLLSAIALVTAMLSEPVSKLRERNITWRSFLFFSVQFTTRKHWQSYRHTDPRRQPLQVAQHAVTGQPL